MLACVIQYVSEFMTPRDLLSLSSTSKAVSKNLVTMELAVSVIMKNGNFYQRKTMELLYEQTSVGSIYPPSSRRVIRLACAKRCERCNEAEIKTVRIGFGLAFCWSCTQLLTSSVYSRPPHERIAMIELDDILRNPRVCSKIMDRVPQSSTYIQHHYIVNEPMCSTEGELIGPIVTVRDLSTFQHFRSPTQIDEYIRDDLKAPPLSVYEPFNGSLRTLRPYSHEIIRERKLTKLAKQLDARKKTWKMKAEVLQKHIDLIIENPELDEELKSIVSEGGVMNFLLQVTKPLVPHLCYSFPNPVVQSIFKPHLRAPSSLRYATARQRVVVKLNQKKEDIIRAER